MKPQVPQPQLPPVRKPTENTPKAHTEALIAQTTDKLKQEQEKLKQQLQNANTTNGESEKLYKELIKKDQQIKQWQNTINWIKNWTG